MDGDGFMGVGWMMNGLRMNEVGGWIMDADGG